MPKDKSYAWYKWFPYKARASERWRKLTITEEGAFRRLYDVAAMCDDPAKRGELWMTPTRQYTDAEIATVLTVNTKTWLRISEKLTSLNLIERCPKNGPYVFPRFATHQHQTGLRRRTDRPKRVPKKSQKSPEAEAEAEAEADTKISTPLTPHEGGLVVVKNEAEGKEKKRPPEKQPAEKPDFAAFWEAYPRKVGKGAGRRAWEKAKKGKKFPGLDAVLIAIAAQKEGAQWRKEGGQFIPLPATWLNQERWADEMHEGKKEYHDKEIVPWKPDPPATK